MVTATALFCAGFLVAQAWALYAFREVAAAVDSYYVDFVLIVALEIIVAGLTFVLGARLGRLSPSLSAYVVAFISGILTNAITVGTYAVVPRVVGGGAQLEVNLLAIGVLAAAMGWVLPKLVQRTGHNAG